MLLVIHPFPISYALLRRSHPITVYLILSLPTRVHAIFFIFLYLYLYLYRNRNFSAFALLRWQNLLLTFILASDQIDIRVCSHIRHWPYRILNPLDSPLHTFSFFCPFPSVSDPS